MGCSKLQVYSNQHLKLIHVYKNLASKFPLCYLGKPDHTTYSCISANAELTSQQLPTHKKKKQQLIKSRTTIQVEANSLKTHLHWREIGVDELIERPVALQASPAHTGLNEAAPDPGPVAAVLDPAPQPAGVVPEPVLPEPSYRRGLAGAGAGYDEREGGESERCQDEDAREEEVEPEERRVRAAAARARESCEKGEDDGGAQDEGRRAEEPLAVRGGGADVDDSE